MRVLIRLARGIEAFSEWCGRGLAWLTLAMVLVTFLVVVLRYLFNLGWIAMQESVIYLHVLVFLVGAAYALKRDQHVRVDIFYARMGVRGKAWVDLLGTLLFLIPGMAFIGWISLDYVAASWRQLEGSPEAGGIPGVFLLKSLVPVMAAAVLLQGCATAIRALAALRGHPKD